MNSPASEPADVNPQAPSNPTIDCVVYRATRRAELYVYLRAGDDVQDLPEALRTLTGRLEQAMELTLSAERTLARADVREVMRALEEQGFYLQMPPPDPQI